MTQIAVIGAGIIGLSSAVKIKEKFKDFNVVLISKDFSPNTTGDGSGGLWYPYLCGNSPQELLTKWGIETYQFYNHQFMKGNKDISMMPARMLYRKSCAIREKPEWTEKVYGYHVLDGAQLKLMKELYSVDYVAGHSFHTFVVRPPHLLEYLYHRFLEAGGKVRQAEVTSLGDSLLYGYDVVVNCTGLGARDIVPDNRVFPIRGQIARVIAPWVKVIVLDADSGNYIIPNTEMCILGGTNQKDNYNTAFSEDDKKKVLEGCQALMPSLKEANVLSHWVGLRPGRDEVRLEAEEIEKKLYIHNYGHGGSGFTLFWGCATDVLALLDKYFSKVTSKL